MLLWWYILYSLIAIVAIALFLPNGIAGGINNLPLLIILLSLLIILYLVKLIRYIKIFSRAKKHLKGCGYTIEKTCIFSPFFGKKKFNIVAKKESQILNIYILNVTKSYLTYHFDDANTVELYKSTRLAIKPSVRQANIVSGHVDTKKVGTKKLGWSSEANQNETNILLFSKFPNLVKDSKHQEGLGNGDKICDKIYLYNLSGFERKTF